MLSFLLNKVFVLLQSGHPITKNTLVKIDHRVYIWLVGGWFTPLKNMSSSIGMMTFPTEWENKIHGNQTTNQNSKW